MPHYSPQLTKVCTRCSREYPQTVEYFEWRSDRKHWRSTCRTCVAETHRNAPYYMRDRAKAESNRIAKRDRKEKRCPQCDNTFPATHEFFHPSKTNICRFCGFLRKSLRHIQNN